MNDCLEMELCETRSGSYCEMCDQKLEDGDVYGILAGTLGEDEVTDSEAADVETFEDCDDYREDHRIVRFDDSYVNVYCFSCIKEIDELIRLACERKRTE